MDSGYQHYVKRDNFPRLPLEGKIDLTYRCNNNCRHCWLRIPPNAAEKENELSFTEIKSIVDQARSLGCKKWAVSGGEPMLRPDFVEIFDYITSHSISYSINTNGTLITPAIARLMKRKGTKMIALYGATAEVNDHITRNPGSFAATMRGFAYLKEAGAGFTVQLIPMKDNYHQFEKMVALAQSLSKHYRVGAPWLYLSSNADPVINAEIKRQRLDPREVIELDKPNLSYEEKQEKELGCGARAPGDDRLFAACLANRRDFQIDPYGRMTFCGFIKDPALLYDLRKGSVADCWDNFIPSLADKVKGTKEFLDGCASCESRKNCRACPVYSYLEHGDFSKKVEYLCAVAKENKNYKENWQKNHRAYYQSGGITIQVEADLPITDKTFHSKLKPFQVDGPGEDTVYISHHFSLPDLAGKDLGEKIYSKPPWSIYKKGDSWIYLGISPTDGEKDLHRVAVFNHDHTRGQIYHNNDQMFLKGELHSLTLFSTDQILLGRLLANREGCYLHSCGVVFNGKGLLFVGHSEAGKSTTVKMLKGKAEILCDDRNIVRKTSAGFRLYGTWSHGEVPEISPNSSPLQAIFFLEKSQENQLIRLTDKKAIFTKLIACLIKSLETTDWWEKELNLLEEIAAGVPVYRMLFDKSGEIVEKLKAI